MYSMIYYPNTSSYADRLIDSLINASRRGVKVLVVLEYRTYNGYVGENLEAFKHLRENGVNVYLDNRSDTDHVKLVIIDGYIVYVGSHNWSESGLKYNHEVSVRIVSKKIADELIEYFYKELIPSS